MRSYWDSSWENVEAARIAEYIDAFNIGADDMIATLQKHRCKRVCDAGCGCGIYTVKLAANGFLSVGLMYPPVQWKLPKGYSKRHPFPQN